MDEKMLIQLHWQNRANLQQTEFVAQTEYTTPDAMHEWVQEIVERRKEEIPEGWCPMVCTSGCVHFVRQAQG